MTMELMLGTAKVDITPLRPVPLAGFSSRKGVHEGVSHPLYLRVWFFRQPDGAGRYRQALLVQADLIWWGSDLAGRLRKRLSDKFGLAEDAIVLHASHTHGGPQTSRRFPPGLGEADDAYLASVVAKLEQTVDEAYAVCEPVRVERGLGACRIGINRRKRSGGRIEWAPNPDGPADPDVTVVRFTAKSGRTKGVWFHYACHPTTTGDNLVTSEFPGVAMEQIEAELGGGAVASFLQGCCGDIRPAVTDGKAFIPGSDEDVVRLGRVLSGEVLRVMQAPLESLPICELLSGGTIVTLPFARLPDPAELAACSGDPDMMGAWSRHLLGDPEQLRQHSAALDVTMLRIADSLTLVAMSGEMVAAYGMHVKARYTGTLPLAYSNGMTGYVPTAEQIAEGGYESVDSAYHFGLPSPFGPVIEERIHEGLRRLLDGEGGSI